MRADVLIVGQGLAGTLLGWEFEQAGIAFEIADQGHVEAATMAAAGIINPVTGRRLVKSWRIESLLAPARATYREIEDAWRVTLWRDLRVRRLFANQTEREAFARKRMSGELAPFVDAAADEAGFWIEGAGRVDLRSLMKCARARWTAAGRLREDRVNPVAASDHYALVIDCTGAAGAGAGVFGAVPWEYSQGEMLELELEPPGSLARDVAWNRQQWLLPIEENRAWVGATHVPGLRIASTTAAARRSLEASARELLDLQAEASSHPVRFTVRNHCAGVRVTLRDKRPLAGRHPAQPRLGVLNALAGKGALWAPWLARQWVAHLQAGAPFDEEIDVARFF